ncbi:hypothetical protein E2C01_041259 [Portunus trituberculatus]|uniref:Uncharacterized protein n=1 Tax=Portunus trituberculatus TaxID=210409 RepID=A0A5B7FIR8_PORTR|nr:hypothetical protein [Portunus trituberculatus]
MVMLLVMLVWRCERHVILLRIIKQTVVCACGQSICAGRQAAGGRQDTGQVRQDGDRLGWGGGSSSSTRPPQPFAEEFIHCLDWLVLVGIRVGLCA